MANASSAITSEDVVIYTQYNEVRADAIGPFKAERVWNDNQKAKFGDDGAEGEIYSDGVDFILDAIGGAEIHLKVNGSTKLSITSSGVELIGDRLFDDNEKLVMGTTDQAEIYFDGTDLIIDPDAVGSGVLDIQGVAQAESLEVTTNAGIQLAVGVANPAHSRGLVFYDSDEETLAVYNNEAAVTIQIGQEMVVRATNKTGVQIDDGDVVYIDGVQGNRPTIALARSDSGSTATIIGVATHDIADNATGFVTVFGIVHSFDTTGFSAGDTLWLDPSTAGAITNAMPTAPNFPIQVGTALNSTGNGTILVNTGPTDVTRTMVIQDLDINSDLRVGGNITVDVISESTPDAGVTIDSVLLKDGLVDGIDVAARDHAKYLDSEAVSAVEAGETVIGGVTPAAGTFTTSLHETAVHILSSTPPPTFTGGAAPKLQISSDDGNPRFTFWDSNDGNTLPNFHFLKSRGSVAAPTTVISGDVIGNFDARGYDGNSFGQIGAMIFASEGTWADGRTPGHIRFETSTDAQPSVLTEVLRLDSSQKGTFAGAVDISDHLTLTNGGTVAQGSGSGKATGVTINTHSGQITMDDAQLNVNQHVSFQVTNSHATPLDVVIAQHASGGTENAYEVSSTHTDAGHFFITVENISGGNLAEAIVINFVIIGGASST